MNLNSTPWITYQETKVPLYNFNLSRYPVAVRSLAEADCENGHMLVEQFKKQTPNQQAKLFEAIQFIHNFLAQTYFQRRDAGRTVGLSEDELREYSRDIQSQFGDANVFASSLEDHDSPETADEAVGPQFVNASAAIADAMTSYETALKKRRQQGAAKTRQIKAQKNKTK